ncbi:MAG: hypothetical protein NTY75_03405 [Candidatus Shapirobacteria bacterium]|nr:hypothetical protein [Candidatus Shapirobacteria bacterium]
MTGEATQDLIHQEPGNPNLVSDNDAARELAQIEKKGQDARVAREKELTEGITKVQKENLQAITEVLPQKYPDAFLGGVQLDDRGRPFLVTKSIPGQANVIINQEGLFLISSNTNKYGDRQPVNVEKAADITRFGLLEPGDTRAFNRVFRFEFKDPSSASEYHIINWDDRTPYCPSVREAVSLGLKNGLETVQKAHLNDPKPTVEPEDISQLF